jgi:hypothetical protein
MKRARGLSLLIAHMLLVVACVDCAGGDSRDARRDLGSAAAAGRSVATAPKLAVDPWFLTADSVMGRYLAVQQYGDTTPVTAFDDCDGGSENDTELAAVGRIRVISHGAVDRLISGIHATRSASHELELTTAARFVPTWTLAGRLHPDSAWRPASATWSDVARLADSVAAASRK